MPAFYQYVGAATEAVGNSMQAKRGQLDWDTILDAWETVEWSEDDTGIVRPPTRVVAGSATGFDPSNLPEPTAEQRKRFFNMLVRKQEEHVSRRRSRRLR
jgi:hypothetical protein